MKLKLFVAVFLLTLPGFASNLPDNPQPQQEKHAMAVPVIKQKGINWGWIAFAAEAGATYGFSYNDTATTLRGLNNGKGCIEGNPAWVGQHPTAGGLYAKNLGITSIIVGVSALLKWRKIPVAPYTIMPIDAFKHAKGVYDWHHFSNGACL